MKYRHPPTPKKTQQNRTKGEGQRQKERKHKQLSTPWGMFTVQSSQYLFKLLLLLLPLCKPPLNFFFQFCVWPDLVHGKGTTIKRICLVTE